MLTWLKNIFGGNYSSTFEKIIAPIEKVVTDLENHIDQNTTLKTVKQAAIADLQVGIKAAEDEVQRAFAAASKIKALIRL